MGYYASITDANFFIAKENHDAAYKAACDLNQRDNLKSGGSYGGELSGDDPRPAGLSYHPARWFSWMDANYPEKCKTLVAVLQEVGFDVNEDADGNIVGLYYDSKTGSEELFLAAISPFVRPDSYISWRGEEGEQWRQEFDGKGIALRHAVVTWV